MPAKPLTIIVAPNGARKTQIEHPKLPMTAEEIALCTEECMRAGAAMVHVHARDKAGLHSLDPELNNEVLETIRRRVGYGVVVQLTTEAVGRYSPQQQMSLIREVQPEAASFALNELIPDTDSEPEAKYFFQWVTDQGILAQFILYCADDLRRYHKLKAKGILPPYGHHLLFVMGRHHGLRQSSPDELVPFLACHNDLTPWAACAFGRLEHQCVTAGLSLGGDVRVGFENNMLNKRGELAVDNAELVEQVALNAKSIGRSVMTADELRDRYSLRRKRSESRLKRVG